ncbi:hypothetical protein G3580_09665 [Nitrogeniibacter mangrovi]|uniref:C-type lysozyme inhibitor domain-containing protein n=1 Tax=Nitrogeniibacter mangrovi TaxID=2016596 RepID=A0A6C1B3B7_9RHOO|nr:hypothetical protein [Nitrogeniibacter mangrovi]QID17883.1 hypothetical protein G3580_09665 [Nitrogeniibacter mangrovi]
MKHPRLVSGLLVLSGIIGAGIGLAVSSPAPASTEFVCTDGERLTVANTGDTLRIRTGTGIFTLQAGDEPHQFLGQSLQLRVQDSGVELLRAGSTEVVRCRTLLQRT